MELYRVQDATGEGPYAPGLFHLWSERTGPAEPLPWWDELGITVHEAVEMLPLDMHVGHAFRNVELMHRWFTRSELAKLGQIGFHVVKFAPDRVVAETETQVVFANVRPHHELTMNFRFAA